MARGAVATEYRESRSTPSSAKKLDHIRLSHGEDGGHLVEHHYHEGGMTYHKPKQYVFGSDEGDELMAHLRKHMKISGTQAESGAAEHGKESEVEE